jgi:hypothetical protein
MGGAELLKIPLYPIIEFMTSEKAEASDFLRVPLSYEYV